MITKNRTLAIILGLLLLPACQNNNQEAPSSLAGISPTPEAATPSVLPSPSVNPALAEQPAPTPMPSPSGMTNLLAQVASLRLDISTRFLSRLGQTQRIAVVPLDARGQAVSGDWPLDWRSSRPQDVSVTADGVVTALTQMGYSQITVRIPGTELEVSINIDVTDPAAFSSGSHGDRPRPTPVPVATLSPMPSAVFPMSDSQRFGPALAPVPGFRPVDGQSFMLTTVSTEATGTDIYTQLYERNAQDEYGPTVASIRVNTFTQGAQYAPTTAMTLDLTGVTAWVSDGQDGDGAGIYAQLHDTEGNLYGDEFRINAYTSGHQYDPAVLLTGENEWVITWTSEGQDGDGAGVFARRYQFFEQQGDEMLFGVPVGDAFQVNAYTTGEQSAPAITALAEGGFVITWAGVGPDGEGSDIYARRYDNTGTAMGEPFRVNTTTQGEQLAPTIATSTGPTNDDFVIAWTTQTQVGGVTSIVWQRYTNAGEPIDDEFMLRDAGASFLADQFMPVIQINRSFIWLGWVGPENNAYQVYTTLWSHTGEFLHKLQSESQVSTVRALSMGLFFDRAITAWSDDAQSPALATTFIVL